MRNGKLKKSPTNTEAKKMKKLEVLLHRKAEIGEGQAKSTKQPVIRIYISNINGNLLFRSVKSAK